MTEPKHQGHGAHRADPDGARNKHLLWAALAGVGVLTITGMGLLLPGEDGSSSAGRTEPTVSAATAEADTPVVVGPTPTQATSWSAVLANPSVDLGRPAEDPATRELVARALYEAQHEPALRPMTEESFKKRARTEGDATPVLAAVPRLQHVARQETSPVPTPAGTGEVAQTPPELTHTVVTRAQWEQWRSEHPSTSLIASDPTPQKDQATGRVDETTLQKSLEQWSQLARPFYALVALDVSKSMSQPALPDGSTRMDLTRRAAGMAIMMFPEHDLVGAWVFSRNLDGARDYREMAPVAEIGAVENGVTHRDRLLGVAAQLNSTEGYTGLYDTTLAAYRQVLADDAPGALRTVIVLTDGQDQDPGSIGLEKLLESLREEQDPDNPVRVITVGISEDADARVLQQIAEATGGTSHIAKKPEDIQEAFMRALTET